MRSAPKMALAVDRLESLWRVPGTSVKKEEQSKTGNPARGSTAVVRKALVCKAAQRCNLLITYLCNWIVDERLWCGCGEFSGGRKGNSKGKR